MQTISLGIADKCLFDFQIKILKVTIIEPTPS